MASLLRNGYLTDERGEAFMPVGLQANNSSTGTILYRKALEAVKACGGNTIETPVYWFLLEPEKDVFCYDHVKDAVDGAREAGLKLILLWFGTSKNGHPNYIPEYMKNDPKTYRLAFGPDGTPVMSLSPHCEAVLERDSNAFAHLMGFLKDYDERQRTVVAVQVENEMGYSATDMDYSPEVVAEYMAGPVPEELSGIRLADDGFDQAVIISAPENVSEAEEDTVAQSIDAVSEQEEAAAGCSPWRLRFGRHAHEAFSAWHTARFIQSIAAAGKAVYKLPLIINVMIGENGFEEPGLCYNAGAAVTRVLDIWKAAAPDIDLIGPDIYLQNYSTYTRVCEGYSRRDNPLFIPESPNRGEANAINMIYAAARYGATGICCFGAEHMLDADGCVAEASREVAVSLRTLSAISPLLVQYRGTGRVHAIVEEEFAQSQYLRLRDYHVEAKFLRNGAMYKGSEPAMYGFRKPFGQETVPTAEGKTAAREETRTPDGTSSLPWVRDALTAQSEKSRGRAILVQTGEREFYLAGTGVGISFVRRPAPDDEKSYTRLATRAASQLNFVSVEEGHFENGRFVADFRRNGDETNFDQYVIGGQLIRIRLSPMPF